MAQQIKKKFIGDNEVDGAKVRIEDGQAVRAMDGLSEIELVKVASSEIFMNGFKVLESSGIITSARLPSYVDDVVEFADLTALNAQPTPEQGKIYITLDDNKQYRWSGSTYIQITSGAVDSVNGQTGVVSLDATHINYVTDGVTIEAKLTSLSTDLGTAQTDLGTAQTDITNLQTELDATQTGAGLGTDGSYVSDETSNYIKAADGATSLAAADSLLDDAIAAVSVVAGQAASDATSAGSLASSAQSAATSALLGVDTIEASAGLDANGAYVSDETSNYIKAADGATSLAAADSLLDDQIKVNADAIAVNASDISGLQGDVSTNTSDISTLQTDVATLQGAQVATWTREKVTLAGGQTSIVLSQTPIAGSEHVFIDRLAMHEGVGEDYTISGSTITFEAGSPFADGDNVYVRYQYLV